MRVRSTECFACGDGLDERLLVAAEGRCNRIENGDNRLACEMARRFHNRRPFAKTKEQLAGFYLIDARDRNDAIE